GLLITEIPRQLPEFIGSEHEVWASDGVVIKATLPGSYGRLWGERRFAIPPEYLHRIELARSAFAFDWRVVGLTHEAGRVRIVTSQPFIEGTPPKWPEIDAFLKSLGFEYHADHLGDHWIREEDSLLVFDAEPGNLVCVPDGIAPIDLILQEFELPVLDES
ncbi:MAG: hypothetical protein AAF585_22560, partial [Verrucomicrobiota bacterium]